MVPVAGVVTLDGKPLANVQVTFDQPELGPNMNKGYIGWTDTEGRYSLRPLDSTDAGAVVGTYRVSLTTAVVNPAAPQPKQQSSAAKPASPFLFEESPPALPELVPAAYRDGKQTFVVPAEGTQSADFPLKSK